MPQIFVILSSVKDYFLRAEISRLISYFPPDFVTVSLRANSCLCSLTIMQFLGKEAGNVSFLSSVKI